MNSYAVIILAALLLEYVLNLVADTLNLRSARNQLPTEFRDVYDSETYSTSQDYLRTTTKCGQIEGAFGLLVLLLFWFAGGFNGLDRLVVSWTAGGWAGHMVVRGLIFVGTLMVARLVLSLPFDIYSTFVIEERFGFNKTTPATFVADRLKGIVLAILLGGPLFAAVLWFFHAMGDLAWLYCWGITAVFTLVVQFIAPRWIMPLFNKFTPLEDGELKDEINDYADDVDFSLEGVYVMDGSRRSTKSNAFFTGFGKHKRIALFDTLIKKHSVRELVTVLAHEIGHYKKKHILQGLVISIVHTGVLFFLLSIFLHHEGLFEAFYMDRTPIYAGFIFFGLLFSPIEMVLSVVLHAFLRRNEYEADRFAVDTTGSAEAFATALKKLSRDNLVNLTPHPFYVALNYSHPPVLKRIRAVKGNTGKRVRC
ncbi:MAG: M48 family metallopeptidase [Candidatus Pacebacteria bacterium]|nr:M48 family metallopeptidase [Candidatus Paceibacterota bacterium]